MYMFAGFGHVLIRRLYVIMLLEKFTDLRACQGMLRLAGHVRQGYGTA